MSSAWQVLVRPVEFLQSEVDKPGIPAQALLAQAVVVCIGAALAILPHRLLTDSYGSAGMASGSGLFALAALLFGGLLAALVLNLLWSALLLCSAAAVGAKVSFIQAFRLNCFALLPLFLGQAAGQAVLAVSRYLPDSAAEAMALRLRPFPFSPVSLPASASEPLSFSWFLLAYFDLFAIWSLLLIYFGLRSSSSFRQRQALWVSLTLVLLLALALSGFWRGAQAVLAV